MSFFKPYCFALLCAVMLVPACSTKPQPAVESPTSAPAAACDGAVFQGQCVGKGDTVTFGQYPQATETPEPIEWIVLDVLPKSDNADGRILLLSKYVIDARAFDTSHKNADGDAIYPTWTESDIRAWLNDTSSSGFLTSPYFSAQDLSLLVEVTNATANNEGNGDLYKGGADAKDKVFLLQESDANKKAYFADDAIKAKRTGPRSAESLMAKATTYAIQHGAWVDNTNGTDNTCANAQCTTHWWLRSPGDRHTCVERVKDDGKIDLCYGVDKTDVGVRPAVWVKY